MRYGGCLSVDGGRMSGWPVCIDSRDLRAVACRSARWAWRRSSARSFCLSVWGSWSVWSNVRWARGRVLVDYWAHHRYYGTEAACGIMDGVRRAQAWVSAQGGGVE